METTFSNFHKGFALITSYRHRVMYETIHIKAV